SRTDSLQVFLLKAGPMAGSGCVLFIKSQAMVDANWRGRALQALSNLGPYESGAGCLRVCDTCSDEKLVGIRFMSRKHSSDCLISTRDRYVELRAGSRHVAHTRLTPSDSTLLTLVHEAFPSDSVGNMSSDEPKSTHPSSPMMREFCEFTYEEVLPEAIDKVAP